MRYVQEKKPGSKTDGYNSKPKQDKTGIPESRKCIGRGFFGGGCGKKFKPTSRWNYIGPCCQQYLRKY